MTGLEPAAFDQAGSLAVDVIRATVPGSVRWAKTQVAGKKIMVVGPTRAGKTTFLEYLVYGYFDPEKPTQITEEVTRSPKLHIRQRAAATLQVDMKTAMDSPGDFGPRYQAMLIVQERPHGVIVVTSMVEPLEDSCSWLALFCRSLETGWQRKARRGNRLKSMIVMLNKQDKVDADAVAERAAAFRSIIDTELHTALGRMRGGVLIMPCAAVKSNAVPQPEAMRSIIHSLLLAMVQ